MISSGLARWQSSKGTPAGETGAGADGEFSLEARQVFKIFLDYEENKLRLVLREDGGERIQMKDYESGQIK